MTQSNTRGMTAVAVALSGVLAGLSAAEAAETRRGDDYVAVIVEAEDHQARDERWIPTRGDTPQQEQDPDGNHSGTASGGTYLELLPDIRVKHGDPFGPPQGFWPNPGTGPRLDYTVDFPEAGRYHLHARIFATGSEDNGIHVGLDGQWPASGRALQICSAGDRAWRWSSRQRNAGNWPCGVAKTIWVTVDEPGTRTLSLSAREDGFEIDRMMLIKDLSGGTRTCEPVQNQADAITCRNGGIEVSDEIVDLELSLGHFVETEIEVEDEETGEESTEIEITIEDAREEPVVEGDTIEIGARIVNRDLFDDATDVTLVFGVDADRWDVVAMGGGCERDGDEVSCAVGRVPPTGSGDGRVVAMTLEALVTGSSRVTASVVSAEEDEDLDDGTRLMDVEVESLVPPTVITAGFDRGAGAIETGAATALTFAVANEGDAPALDVVLSLELPEGLEIDETPGDCSATETGLACPVGTLGVGASRDIPLNVSAGEEGTYAVAVSAVAANAGENAALISLSVADPVVIEPEIVEPEVVEPEEKEVASGGEGEPDTGTTGDTDGGPDDESTVTASSGSKGGGGAFGASLALALLLSGAARRRAGRPSRA